VLTQLAGATMRACVVILVIATPALMIPGTSPEGAQGVMLVALALGVFVAVEYASTYPGLIAFRDAPPFNRLRLLALFVTLFLLSLIATGESGQGSSLALIVNAFGIVVAEALDFPFSPVQMIGAHLPPGLDPFLVAKVQGMTGLATLVLLATAGLFALMTRLGRWPHRDSPFNVWINLPTFDPNGGGDIVKRLRRTGALTMIAGAVAPFVLPVVGVVAANHVGLDVLGSPHALVWGITLWMFIPLSLIMRGLAMSRIAAMIGQRRDRLMASLASDAPSAPALSR
jgi:hypothetical protein